MYTVSLLIEIYLPLNFKLISLIHVAAVFWSGQSLSVNCNKCNNSLTMQKRGTVLVHCVSPH